MPTVRSSSRFHRSLGHDARGVSWPLRRLACSALAIVTTPGEVAAQLSCPPGTEDEGRRPSMLIDMSFLSDDQLQIFFGHGVIEHGSGADWGNRSAGR